jgi:hypothetical protein
MTTALLLIVLMIGFGLGALLGGALFLVGKNRAVTRTGR